MPSYSGGYLGGSSEVTPEGGYRWSLPIAVPPGRAGMAPALGVELTSGGGNDLLGVGGSLVGLSEIQRCGQVYAIDAQATAANFTDTDRFCLDGQRLVVVKGTYGEDGSEYRTERDTFQKIIFHDTDPTKPSSFTVWSKDGKVATYAGIQAHRAEPASSPPYALSPVELVTVLWVLSTTEDRAGNQVAYHYKTVKVPDQPDLSTIEVLPDRIEYTYRKGRVPEALREVRFLLEDRPDPSFSFLSGVRIRSTKRLKAIELYAPNPITKELVGRYKFTYDNSSATHRSLLQTISRCDAENVCLWDKKFEWETSPPVDFEVVDLGSEFPDAYFVQAHDSGFLVVDLDGDSRDEVLYRYGLDYVIRRTGPSGAPLGNRSIIDPVASAGNSQVGFESIRINQTRAVDIDGDGGAELFAAQVPYARYYLFEWNAAAGGLVSMGTDLPADYLQNGLGDPYLSTIVFGDTQGDGLPDVFDQVFVPPSDTLSRWWIHKNAGDGSFEDAVATGVDAYCGQTARIIDRNGSGRAEIWNASNFGCTQSHVMGFDTAGQPVVDHQSGLGYDAKRALFADLNGDGLRDLVMPQLGGGWVRFSTGVGYGPKHDLVDGPEPDGNVTSGMDQGTHVADLNQDGLEDLLAFRFSPGPNIIAYLSLGDGSFDARSTGLWPGFLHDFEGFTTTRPGDFNGDGKLDLVKIDLDGHVRVLLQKPGVVDMVRKVWDYPIAEHPREVITYSSAWSDNPKAASCAYPQRCVRHGIPVVREQQQWQGEDVGKYRTLRYSYDDPRVDLRGRGFLGFGEMRVWDVDRLSQTTITFDNETRVGALYPYAGLPARVVQITPIWKEPPALLPAEAVARVTRVDTTYEVHWLNLFKSHFVYPASWTSKEWELKVKVRADGISVLEERVAPLRERSGATEVDNYGNVTMAEEETKGGVYRRVDTIYHDADEGTWLVALPKRVDVISAKSSASPLPEPRRTDFFYDTRGFLETVFVEPTSLNLNQQMATTFARNGDGLVTQVTSAVPGVLPRNVHIAYDDAEGMFPVQVWNDLGFTESSAFTGCGEKKCESGKVPKKAPPKSTRGTAASKGGQKQSTPHTTMAKSDPQESTGASVSVGSPAPTPEVRPFEPLADHAPSAN